MFFKNVVGSAWIHSKIPLLSLANSCFFEGSEYEPKQLMLLDAT